MTHLWRVVQILLIFPFLAAMVLALWETWVKDSRVEPVALGVGIFLVLGIWAIQRRIRQLKNPQAPGPEMPVEQDVAITRYIIRFGVAYTLGLIALSVIFTIFDLDHNTGASIGLLIGAALYVAGKFIQDNKRVPGKKERSKLVWFSFLTTWLASALLFLVSVLAPGEEQRLAEIVPRADQLSIPLIAGVFGFVSLLYLAILEYSFGGLAEKHYAGLKKKGKL